MRITLDGQVLAVNGIAEKVFAAHCGDLGRVLLPLGHRRQVDEDLDDGLRRTVVVDYVTRTEELGRSGAVRWPTVPDPGFAGLATCPEAVSAARSPAADRA